RSSCPPPLAARRPKTGWARQGAPWGGRSFLLTGLSHSTGLVALLPCRCARPLSRRLSVRGRDPPRPGGPAPAGASLLPPPPPAPTMPEAPRQGGGRRGRRTGHLEG